MQYDDFARNLASARLTAYKYAMKHNISAKTSYFYWKSFAIMRVINAAFFSTSFKDFRYTERDVTQNKFPYCCLHFSNVF